MSAAFPAQWFPSIRHLDFRRSSQTSSPTRSCIRMFRSSTSTSTTPPLANCLRACKRTFSITGKFSGPTNQQPCGNPTEPSFMWTAFHRVPRRSHIGSTCAPTEAPTSLIQSCRIRGILNVCVGSCAFSTRTANYAGHSQRQPTVSTLAFWIRGRTPRTSSSTASIRQVSFPRLTIPWRPRRSFSTALM